MTDEDLVDNGTFGGSSSSFVKAEETTAQRFSALQTQLLCAAIHFFHRHIRSDADVLQRMEGNEMFRLFFEVPYHNKPELNRIFPESVHDSSALHVCSFILSILHQGIFSVSAFIVSVIYLSRFKESSRITLHACTWRPLFLTSLLLADKMWEDKPVRNSSLAKLFPVLSNVELNRMESEFLDEIKFNVLVKPDLFCSFCEKLLAEQVHQEISRCVIQSEYAVTLQAECVDSIPKVNGKAQVVNSEKLNGKNHEKLAEWQTSADRKLAIHEVPATWADPSMHRGRSQSPTGAVKPGLLSGDVHYYAQPIEALRPLVQHPSGSRSGSVQPRHDGKGQVEVADPFRGASVVAAQPAMQPMRRSLPAKSSNANTQYMMLARAPSVGSTQCGAIKVPPGAVPCNEANGCISAGGPVMAVTAGLAGGMQHSPRSPPAATPVGPNVQGSSHRSQTPPATACQAHMALRGAPVVAHGISCVQPKPRSSSAPRVANVAYAHGANVRASSQPMHPNVVRQVPTQQPCMQAQFSGGRAPYARQVMVSDMGGPVSPVGVPAQMAAPVTRGTIGGYPVRNASPAVSTPTSPGMCHVQVSQMKMAARGRSPAPVVGQGIRAPRAATPTTMVKPTAPGVHAVGMMPRHSLGAQVRRPGLA